MASQLKLSPSLNIPATMSALYPFSLRLTDRRDEPLLTPGRACYVRLVDEDEVKVDGLLFDTSGSVLTASASESFPSADGWYVLTSAVTGLFEGNVAVSSEASAGAYELQAGWIQFGAVRQDRAQTAFAAAASLTAVTDILGTPAGASPAADVAAVYARIGLPGGDTIAGDIASLALSAGSLTFAIGTPAADVSSDIAAVLYQTQVTNNYVPNIGGAVSLCQGTLAYGGHTTTNVKSPQVPASEIDYTGMRLLVRRAADSNAEIRTIDSQSFVPPRSWTVTAGYSFTPQDGDTFAVLAP